MKRRSFLKTCCLGIIAGSAPINLNIISCRENEKFSLKTSTSITSRPNFVIIMADDLGYGDVGCYGNKANKTPNIDALAAEGIKFTDFHSNGPVCSPTRAALLTGRYQQRMGIETALGEGKQVMWPDVVTIADRFKDAGYATGAFGKWHVGMKEHPLDHGFDKYSGNMHGGVDYISHVDRYGNIDWWQNKEIRNEEGFNTSLVTDSSVRFIEKHKNEPFFLYVPYSAIHFPWMTPDDDAYRETGGRYTDLSKLGPHRNEYLQSVVKRMIEELDKGIGRIVAALRKNDLERNTLVFFLSDNGGYLNYGGRYEGEFSSNGPFRGQKGSVFEGGHRVPGIAWWPGKIKAGTINHTTVMTMDLMPTCLSIAQLDLPSADDPHAQDGINISPILFENDVLPERTLFWRFHNQKAARKGSWKLVQIRADEPQLFNLERDPGENRNLALQQPDIVKDLLAAFKEWERDL